MGGGLISVEFKPDSFNYFNSKFSDVLPRNDTCHVEVGYDCAAGTYKFDSTFFYFSGNWTDNTFNNILSLSGCNTGKFELTYNYQYYSNHMIELNLIDSKNLAPNSVIFTHFFCVDQQYPVH